MPLIPALGRQRQVDLCEFKASRVYKLSFRTIKATQKNLLVSTNKQTKNQKRKERNMTIIYVIIEKLQTKKQEV